MSGIGRLPIIVEAGDRPTIRGEVVDRVAIVTQTCDVIRDPVRRPYLQLARVVSIDDPATLPALQRGSTPGRVWLPGAGPEAFADLDTIATIAKTALLDPLLVVHPGATSEDQYRIIGHQIGRVFGRFAFPDDVTATVDPMRRRLVEKARGQGSEGAALSHVEEIRAAANPGWEAGAYEVELSFILAPGTLSAPIRPPSGGAPEAPMVSAPDAAVALAEAVGPAADTAWNALIGAWIRHCKPSGAVTSVRGEPVNAEEYTIDRMWRSARLDLDEVSWPDEG